MAIATLTERFRKPFRNLGFLVGSLPQIIIWPLLSLVLGLLLSGLAVSRLNDDRDTAQRDAGQRVDGLAQAYADYLSRLLEQLDLITLHVKHDWEASDGQLDLDRLFKAGLYPSTARVFVTIVNRTGDPTTSTRPIQKTFNIADRDYFRRHRFNPSPALAIGIPLQGNRTPEPIIRFTRRLVDSKGEFDGIVVVSVLPALLASFYADASLGKQGFLTVIGEDGVLRASRLGPDTQVPPKTILLPGMPFMPNTGVELRPADAFSDRVPRVVASRPLKPYPLIAVVGLSQSEILAAYRINEATYRSAANAGMVLLTLFALVATALSIRLAWRKHQAEQVESTYRMAIDGGHEGFYMVRALTERGGAIVDFLIEDCNERGAAFVGSTRATLIGTRFSDLYSGHHAQVVLGIFRGAMASGFYEDEFLVSPHSPLRSAWMHRRLVRSGAGLAMTLRDISEAKQHEQMLSKLANSDALTLLPNRHWMMQFLPQALQRAQGAGMQLAVLFVDLDDFKTVNDTQGHAAGDALLCSAAQRLKSVLKEGDSITRLGGDEFTIVLENLDTAVEAEAVARRIGEAFRQPFSIGADTHTVGVSVGISLYPDHTTDPDALLRYADIAMYAAKQDGKARYCLYQEQLSKNLMVKFNTRKALELALERDEFVLYYQPRVNAISGEFCSMEALVRWIHPTRGLVPPLAFIPLAEETGLILKLGEVVIEKACAQIALWQAEGMRPLPVSINVSLRQFNQADLKQQLVASMERHGIAAHLIEIELTESCMMAEQMDVAHDLAALQALGIKLLVDDFGTGYSSLSQLQQLDLDILKVDRAFTAELGKTSEGVVFFSAIISMAHALDMSVVAEGVETAHQLQLLQDLGCDEVQGYYVSRPVPAAEIPALRKRSLLFPTMPVASPSIDTTALRSSASSTAA
ncbi:MAG: EAL domain-containing protein [Herminiimonas sp.]|nr:EAL domain-containing protein [Herminiimonas sp.]